jgi:hypothetical protein
MALNSLGLGFVFTARDLASAKMTSLERRFSSLDDRVSGGTERITGAFRELGIGLAVFTAGAATCPWIDLGYVPCDSRAAGAADLLFNIISRRHEKRSVVITTNLAFEHWRSVFHDASCLGALVDRFAQHCHVIDIEAESWRRNDGSPTPKQRHGPKGPKKRT